MNMNNAKNRVPNFTSSEKMHLMQIIANKYSSTLEDKKTDRVSASQKEMAWKAIENDFNASSSNSTFRNAACLKKCYENRKKELRKSIAEERKQTILTGGGPAKKVKKDDSDDILRSILNDKTLVGLKNQYDDDANDTCIEFQEDTNQVEIEFIYNPEEDQDKDHETDSLQTSNMLGDLDNSRTLGTAKSDGDNNNSTILGWKKYTPNKLKTPISDPLQLKQSIEKSVSNGDCITSTNKTPKNSGRRRPTTIIKPMTSSDIAKKYDILLDKRIQLVDVQLKHAETEHSLNITKKNLEIELLKIELAKKNI